MKLEVSIRLTPQQVAQAFCELNDDDQAQVFIEIGEISKTWDAPPSMQWYAIGDHLRTCDCSTYEARQLVQEIADAIRDAPAPVV